MGPISGVLFLIGVIMVFVGKNPNNDSLFSWRGSDFDNDAKFDRIRFMIMGILFIIAAVVMWVYLAVNGEPSPLPDYNSMMNRNSSQ